MGKRLWNERVNFIQFQPIVQSDDVWTSGRDSATSIVFDMDQAFAEDLAVKTNEVCPAIQDLLNFFCELR